MGPVAQWLEELSSDRKVEGSRLTPKNCKKQPKEEKISKKHSVFRQKDK